MSLCRQLVALVGFVLLARCVESHDELEYDDLRHSLRGYLIIGCVVVVVLIALVLLVLSLCCCYTVCMANERVPRLHKRSGEEGIHLTKFEETELGSDDKGEGQAGSTVVEPKGVTVTVIEVDTQEENTTSTFGHSVDKKESAETSGGENKEPAEKVQEEKKESVSKEVESSQPPKEVQSDSVPVAPPPPPPPPPLDAKSLNPSIMKQKQTSETPEESKPAKEKTKPVIESGASSIMQELSLAILKPKLASKPQVGLASESKETQDTTKATESSANSESKDTAGDAQSKSPDTKVSETLVPSQEDIKPKLEEKPQDSEKKEESSATLMNFADIDSALGQALKDLGDF